MTSISTFDPTRPLAMALFATVYGFDLDPGTPLVVVDHDPAKAGEVDQDTAERLWLSTKAIYATDLRPTPAETPEQELDRLTQIDELGGNWFLIRSPGRDAEKVQGRAAADQRRADIVAGKAVPAPTAAPVPVAEPTGGPAPEPEQQDDDEPGTAEVNPATTGATPAED